MQNTESLSESATRATSAEQRIAQLESDLALAEARRAEAERQRDEAKALVDSYYHAMSLHLCAADMADWLACAGGHGTDNCEICDEADKGLHRHALQVRWEASEKQARLLRAALVECRALVVASAEASHQTDGFEIGDDGLPCRRRVPVTQADRLLQTVDAALLTLKDSPERQIPQKGEDQ